MENNIKKILVLAPHPDDGEFGCGGSLKKFAENGSEIFYAAFSPCFASIPEGFEKNILFEELKNATAHLDIPDENVFTFDFPVRKFPEHRQEILESLVVLRKKINADLVILPNSQDIHQDHQTIHNEGVRAFKNVKIIGYELPWNNFTFTSNFTVILEEKHVEAKFKAIQEYKTQSFRKYNDKDFFLGLARVRGTQIGADLAEAFELIRWIA